MVYKKGKSIANRQLVAYVLKNNGQGNRLGISVSKKVGNSVMRSRVTRLIKENYRLHEKELKSGYDIVIIARSAAAGAKYDAIGGALLHLFKKHRLLLSDMADQSSESM